MRLDLGSPPGRLLPRGWEPPLRLDLRRLPVGMQLWYPDLVAGPGDVIDPLNTLTGPAPGHVFGTDQLGRDVFDRVVHGARASLAIGLGATALGAVCGIIWGLVAGLGTRWMDEGAMRVADVFLSVPATLLALLVVVVLGPGGPSVAIAIAIAIAPGFARIVRVHTLVARRAGYVQAATVLGVPRFHVIRRHVVPNILPPMVILATMNIGQSIIAAASLSFLGLGATESSAEWGSMLAQSRDTLQDAWAPAVFPGLALTLTVISFSVIGRELQARLEGRNDL